MTGLAVAALGDLFLDPGFLKRVQIGAGQAFDRGDLGTCRVGHRHGARAFGDAVGTEITTIEGLAGTDLHPLQKAWIEGEVPQCGYCQPGQLMTAAGLLNRNPNPSEEQIVAEMSGVLCRCGTYLRIKKAVAKVAKGGK